MSPYHGPLSLPGINVCMAPLRLLPAFWTRAACPSHAHEHCGRASERVDRRVGEFLPVSPGRESPHLRPRAPFLETAETALVLDCPLIPPEENKSSQVGWNQYSSFSKASLEVRVKVTPWKGKMSSFQHIIGTDEYLLNEGKHESCASPTQKRLYRCIACGD